MWQWFLLAIIFSALPTTDGATAYVRPSGASRDICPGQPCLSFSDYAREKDQYFLNGTSFVFLSGTHQLNLQLQLENVSNISLGPLEGAGSVQVHLSPMVNITWLGSNNVTVAGLQIYLNGQQMSERLSFAALIFERTTSFLSRLSFFGNDRLQSTAIRTHSSVIGLSDVTVSGATSLYGAALVMFNSTVNFTGKNHFMNSTATRGGAMYIFQSFAYFDGHAYFINNSATSDSALGGAIYCENSSILFSGSVLFQNNQAIAYFAYGGGIFQQNSTVIFDVHSDVAFIENSAMLFGGAVSINRSELIMLGDALFKKKFARSGGGALNGQQNSRILIMCNSGREKIKFQNNYLDYRNSSGGAIFT
jgi:predicted outer membrane repeat protein